MLVTRREKWLLLKGSKGETHGDWQGAFQVRIAAADERKEMARKIARAKLEWH